MMGQALLRTSFAVAVLALIASCAEYETPSAANVPAPTPQQGYWNGDGVPGSPKIVVSISDQRAYFYKGKHLVGESTVSTGKPGFGTPPGYYTVFWKDAAHVSTVFGDYVDDLGNVVKSNIDSRKDSKPPGSHYDGARMPFAMFFRGGYAMHQGYVPPYAASHGCIRLPAGMAETFFNASPPGTPVIVKQEAVMRPGPVPAVDVQAPPAPYLVRSTAPASVRPATVRTTVSAPTPIRSPAPVLLRAPATVPSPTPTRYSNAPVRYPSPAPLRSPSPAPSPYSSPARLRSSALVPVRSPSPVPVRPTSVRSTVPVPAPTPLRSPAPASVRSPATTSVTPTPTPVRSHTRRRHHSRTSGRLPTPSPTPTPAPGR
jgi:hypothetical protein